MRAELFHADGQMYGQADTQTDITKLMSLIAIFQTLQKPIKYPDVFDIIG
jgi:hypothetical protein